MKKKYVCAAFVGFSALLVSIGFSWAQAKPWGHIPDAANRFVVLAEFDNLAVLDRSTGLIWEKNPETTTSTWTSKINRCLAKSPGGPFGWRMPRWEEMGTLFISGAATPGGLLVDLPAGHPFTNVAGDYWTSSPNPLDPADARLFGTDTLENGFTLKTGTFRAWCVRGGAN